MTASIGAFALDGRRILVTGAGRGLGAGIASGLVAAGGTVALLARSKEQVLTTAAELGPAARPVVCDVQGPAGEIVDLAEDALDGPVDVVVHAAGVQHRQAAENFDPSAWDRVISVNLTAPFHLSKEIGVRQLARGSGGSHIFIGSLASLLSVPGAIAYTASKSGLFGVVRGLSTEWSGRGIRVNAIGPGYFRTELTKAVVDDPIRGREILSRVPMGRLGDPADLANVATFFASDASAYVTGQLLMVDGGWTAA